MKRILLLLLLLALGLTQSYAQYQTPGTGRRYSLAQLAALSGGYVTQAGGSWLINDTIRLAATDSLLITTNETIRVAAGALITIDGKLLVNPPDSVKFTAQNGAAPWHSLWFTGTSTGSALRRTIIEQGCGVRVVSSTVVINRCIFRQNVARLGTRQISNGALTLSGSSGNAYNVVENCRFVRNARSAIISPANVLTRPFIDNCTFIENNTDNGNYPQINLGPSDAPRIVVRNCTVVGSVATNMGGGIAISNLLGGGAVTRATIIYNTVRRNRYGIAIVGNNIQTQIIQNLVENNNTNPSALTGGSGLNFQGDRTQRGTVARNIIRGNLWGVTLQKPSPTALRGPRISFGNPANLSTDTADVGLNQLFNNGNGGQVYDLYNNTPDSVMARNNWWGTAVAAVVETHIYHKADEATLGFVDYLPLRTQGPLAARPGVLPGVALYPNPAHITATLALPEAGTATLTLRDATGREVYRAQLRPAADQTVSVPLTGLAPGLYLYQAEQAGRRATGRLVVE
ncbi:T9SS type A sorting domain-containing protein [Hymenobacter sp. BT175]|uniref:T9SS type A sorting domain-containing protein n=1 Tax=Hymenobacter translucens TaxID=2886507 RepID=UPI001D0E48AA|nr:T9SS type A sorting domain-containing protein [Hymenobacter translucens]MCC2547499.1 T9SS type A sorting domain-containing protein [Hymenobacter translucens]